jgi:WD40 repeat protein
MTPYDLAPAFGHVPGSADVLVVRARQATPPARVEAAMTPPQGRLECGRSDLATVGADDSTLAVSTGETQCTAELWDVASARPTASLDVCRQLGTASVNALAISHDASLLAIADHEGGLIVWDMRTGTLRAGPFSGHANGADIDLMAFNADGTRLASYGEDWTIRVWSIPSAPGSA